MAYTYPHPGNEHEFEEFCLRFYRHYLKKDGLVLYAKRGEEQDGIDIIDQVGAVPFVAIQCKNHERTKTIPPKEIKDEVSYAEGSPHKISRYIIATTAKKSRNAQDTVLELNQDSSSKRKFTVEIHFWEDLNEILNGLGFVVANWILHKQIPQDELQQHVQIATKNAIQVHTSASDAEGPELYVEIFELFKERKLEVAKYKIDMLPDPELESTLDSQHRYALLRLRGKLAMETMDFDEGARLYQLAYQESPKLPQARLNRVLALEFSGDQETALAEAKSLLDEGADGDFLLSMLIRCASDPKDLLPYKAQLEAHAENSAEVNTTLAHKYLRWDRVEEARAAADMALKLVPDSAHVLFASGSVEHRYAYPGEWRSRPAHLQKAIEYYSQAFAAAKRDKYVGLIPEILMNRASVFAISGDFAKAGADYRQAINESEKPWLYAERAISFFMHIEDVNSASELSHLLRGESDEGAFLITSIRYHKAVSEEEKATYIEEMIKVADLGTDRTSEARFLAVNWAVNVGRHDLAEKAVPDSFLESHAIQGHTLRGWIASDQGNKEEARKHARLAMNSDPSNVSRQELSILGRLLMHLCEYESALPVLEQATEGGKLDTACKQLLDCAQELDRHDVVLRVCSELRQSGSQDDLARRLEVAMLSRYDVEKALELSKEFQVHDRPYFTACINFFSVKLGRTVDLILSPKRLPSPESLSPDQIHLVIQPYIAGECFNEVIEFSYAYLRKHLSVAMAHSVYAWLITAYAGRAGIETDLKEVDSKSAVCLEEVGGQRTRWVIIEDDNPDATRGEVASTSDTAKSLLGKSVGDEVDLSSSPVQKQKEKITEILPKQIRLFHDTIRNFQQRFPGQGSIQTISIGEGDDFDPSYLIEVLRERRSYVEGSFKVYRENPCPLTLFATQLGISELELMLSLSESRDDKIRCSYCTTRDFAHRSALGFRSAEVVLDLSAIITITRLNAWHILPRNISYLVSTGTYLKLRSWLAEPSSGIPSAKAYGAISDDGKLVITDVSEEREVQKRKLIEQMCMQVESRCQVLNAYDVSGIEPSRRKRYEKTIGLHSTESLSLARSRHATLWTDDHVVSFIAGLDFSVYSVWSQLAFYISEQSRVLNTWTYRRITAQLLGWNYVPTVWVPPDIFVAGQLAKWDPTRWPLDRCLELFGNHVPLTTRLLLVLEFFDCMRLASCGPEQYSRVIETILDHIGSVKAAQWLRVEVLDYFAGDFETVAFLRHEIKRWENRQTM